jgi:hypothetical protein
MMDKASHLQYGAIELMWGISATLIDASSIVPWPALGLVIKFSLEIIFCLVFKW